MEKMPVKWMMNHQLSFLMALMFILLDLTNEVSSGTVSQASQVGTTGRDSLAWTAPLVEICEPS